MRRQLFIWLVIVWPLVFAVVGWLFAADAGMFAGDPRRTSKLFVMGLIPWGFAFFFGLGDAWKLRYSSIPMDWPSRFLHRTHTSYGLLFASVAAAYIFAWFIGVRNFRLFPFLTWAAAFGFARMNLKPEHSESPRPPDRSYHRTSIPDSVTNPRKPGE